MSVLIAEDNPVSARVFEGTLRRSGYTTVVVENGKLALKRLKAMPDIQLVITDVVMPEMGGLQLLSEIREDPELADIPVVICSSSAEMDSVKQAARKGCRRYILKPVDPQQLIRIVNEAIGEEKAVLLEKAKVIHKLGLDGQMYDKIAGEFAGLVAIKIALLEKLKAGESPGEPSVNFQDIKETAKLLGAELLSDILDELESHSPEIRADAVRRSVPRLLRVLKSLSHALPPPLHPTPAPEKAVEEDETDEEVEAVEEDEAVEEAEAGEEAEASEESEAGEEEPGGAC